MSGTVLPLRIERNQFRCNILNGSTNTRFRIIPFLASELMDLWLCAFASGILLDLIELRRQHIKTGISRVIDLHVVLFRTVYGNTFNAAIDADSVLFVHHIISDIQIRKVFDRIPGKTFSFSFLCFTNAKDIYLGDHGEFIIRIGKSYAHRANLHIRLYALFLQFFDQALCTQITGCKERDRPSVLPVLFKVLYQIIETAVIRRNITGIYRNGFYSRKFFIACTKQRKFQAIAFLKLF